MWSLFGHVRKVVVLTLKLMLFLAGLRKSSRLLFLLFTCASFLHSEYLEMKMKQAFCTSSILFPGTVLPRECPGNK